MHVATHPIGAHRLAARGVSHRFGSTLALDDVSLEFPAGELTALLGPSGCGKTTLLRSIAGFVRPDRGDILIDGEPIGALPPGSRGVGIVFQSYALFPHMSVAENVGYGLKARGVARARVAARVAEVLEQVRLTELAGRLPRALSGGQQQRVALARVVAVEPRILLLDEPFSALDRGLRLDMQIEIKRLQRALGITAVMVTHDQDEAMSMADRIAVMNQGRIHQFASPVDLYDDPSDLFVSQFVGTTNLLPGRIAARDGANVTVALEAGGTLTMGEARALPDGARVLVSLRPENIALDPADGLLAADLTVAMPIGADMLYEATIPGGGAVKCIARRDRASPPRAPGARVFLRVVDPGAARLFPHPV